MVGSLLKGGPVRFPIFRIAITSPYPFSLIGRGVLVLASIIPYFFILSRGAEKFYNSGRRAAAVPGAGPVSQNVQRRGRESAQASGMAQGSRSRADSDPLPSPISCKKTSGISPTMTDSATSRRWLTVMGRDIRGRMSLSSVSTSR